MTKHYHFIGVGGIGMGALASLILAKGHKVSGSDLKESALFLQLKEKGADVRLGHAAGNVTDPDFVVYSSAVRPENPEFAAAVARGIPILKRAQLLAQLMENHTGVTIAGAHGKTTTTSMTSLLLINAGLNPTTAVGGLINSDAGYNAHLGRGQYFVAEVDESDGSFLYFNPVVSVVTNIDFEHIDHYHTWENILAAYREFLSRTRPDGKLIVCGDDARLLPLAQAAGRHLTTYGLDAKNDISARNISLEGSGSSFDCVVQGQALGRMELEVPGRHNILNAMACVAVGLALGIDKAVIQKTLKEYRGVKRRFQTLGEAQGVRVVDDYGHHPTEIRATLQAARQVGKGRLIVAFQPHRYTRTKFLMDEFVACLTDADHVIITDIYAASELPIEGVSSGVLCEKLAGRVAFPVEYLSKEKILPRLKEIVRSGDMVLTLGAGDIYRVGEELVRHLTLPEKELGHIGVLMGGCSSEREISLKSGKAVVAALESAGCRVSPIVLDSVQEEDVASVISAAKIDVAFIALHGKFGEDGAIQAILERLEIPYTGSGVLASQKAINKATTQTLLKKNGIDVPDFMVLVKDDVNIPAILKHFGQLPVVVKPAKEGSSIGVTVVSDESALSGAIELAFQYGEPLVIERYIAGRELTAGVLDDQALPLVEVRAKSQFFDFKAKYQQGMTEYIVPAQVPEEIKSRIQYMALKAHRVLGCRDFSRADFMVDEKGHPFLLEVNTIPGFTATSLLPKAAAVAGYDFTGLCLRLVRMAAARRSNGAHQQLVSGSGA